MKAKLFVKKGCSGCDEVKKAVGDKVQVFDADTVDGRAEADYYEVDTFPKLIMYTGCTKQIGKYLEILG